MFSGKLTEKSKLIITRAIQYAGDMGLDYVGSEHMLLGLISDEETASYRILTQLGLTFDVIKNKIEESTTLGSPTQLGFEHMTPRTKRILETAAYASSSLNSTYIGPEHILLGVLKDSSCFAVKILQDLGVDERDVLQLLSEYFSIYNQD